MSSFVNGTPQVDEHPNHHNTLHANQDFQAEDITQLKEDVADLKAVSPRKGDPGDPGPQGPTGPVGPRGEKGAPGVVNKLLDKNGADVTAGTIQFMGDVEKVGGTLKVYNSGNGGGGGGEGSGAVTPIPGLNYPFVQQRVGIEGTGFPGQSGDRSVYVVVPESGKGYAFDDDDLERTTLLGFGATTRNAVVANNGGSLFLATSSFRYFPPGSSGAAEISQYRTSSGVLVGIGNNLAGGAFYGGDGFAYIGLITPVLDGDGDYKRLLKFDLSTGDAPTAITDYQGMFQSSGFTPVELNSNAAYPSLSAGRSATASRWALVRTGASSYKMMRRPDGSSTWAVLFGNFAATDLAPFRNATVSPDDGFVASMVTQIVDPDGAGTLNVWGVRKFRANGTIGNKADLTPGRSSEKGELAENRVISTDASAFACAVELEPDYFAIMAVLGAEQYEDPVERPWAAVPVVWLVNATGAQPTRQALYTPDRLTNQLANDEATTPGAEEIVFQGSAADETGDGTKTRITFSWSPRITGAASDYQSTDQVQVPVL